FSYTFTGGTDTHGNPANGVDNAIFGWLCTTGESATPIGAIDETSGVDGPATATTISVTTTAADSLIIGSSYNNNNSGTMSATGPGAVLAWHEQETSPDTGSENGLYQTASTTGTYTPGFSWVNNDNPVADVGVEVLAQ